MPQFVRKQTSAPTQTQRPQPRTGAHPSDATEATPRERRPRRTEPETMRRPLPSEPVRINKVLADAGVCSRRKADELVAQGRVTVNGQTVTEAGYKVRVPEDCVCVDGKALQIQQPLTYVILHKPTHCVSTVSDPEGRTTVLDFLPQELRSLRLYPVGRLDYFSEGLLLLTNDGELAQRMTHPRHHLPKIYQVLVRGEVSESALQIMRRGMTLTEGEKLAPVGIAVHPAPHPQDTLLRMTLRQGVNRQIRRMCRDVGLTILGLRRVAQGPLELKGLPKGSCRLLHAAEVRELRAAVDLA